MKKEKEIKKNEKRKRNKEMINLLWVQNCVWEPRERRESVCPNFGPKM